MAEVRLALATYATAEFEAYAVALGKSAITAGFSNARVWGPADLAGTEFAVRNRAVLSMPRGGGYWLWKPYVIRQTLKTLREGDALLYCDAGRSDYYCFTRFPSALLAHLQARGTDFLLGPSMPHQGPLERWTKRDCLITMGADVESIRMRPVVAATWSLWLPRSGSLEFLERWLRFCEDRRCLTDDANVLGLPNYDSFVDHRHDQVILSILAYQAGARYVDFSRTRVQRVINWRPDAAVSHLFYKRPGNADDLLRADNPLLLAREVIRLRRVTR